MTEQRKDLTALFVGAFVQWTVMAALTRFLASGHPAGIVGAAFLSQTIWYWNINQVIGPGKVRTVPRWLAWSVGASAGAFAGYLLTP